jgi:hypothetical protein
MDFIKFGGTYVNCDMAAAYSMDLAGFALANEYY